MVSKHISVTNIAVFRETPRQSGWKAMKSRIPLIRVKLDNACARAPQLPRWRLAPGTQEVTLTSLIQFHNFLLLEMLPDASRL